MGKTMTKEKETRDRENKERARAKREKRGRETPTDRGSYSAPKTTTSFFLGLSFLTLA
jgi:hypothetical protein